MSEALKVSFVFALLIAWFVFLVWFLHIWFTKWRYQVNDWAIRKLGLEDPDV